MRRSLIIAGAALVVAVLLFPTMGTPLSDEQDEEEGLVLAPSDGPNGVYAELDADGELRLNLSEQNQDLAGDGINNRAETAIDSIFTINNTNDQTAAVWLETGVDGAWFYQASDRTSPLNENSTVHLEPDGNVSVGLFIDTTAPDHEIEEMTDFSIHAESVGSGDKSTGSDSTTDDDTTTDQQTGSSPEQSDDQTADPPSDESDGQTGDQTDSGVDDTDDQTGDGIGDTDDQTGDSPADEQANDSEESADDGSETESSETGSGPGTGSEGPTTGIDSFGGDEETLGGTGLWVLLILLIAAVVGALSATVTRRGFG